MIGDIELKDVSDVTMNPDTGQLEINMEQPEEKAEIQAEPVESKSEGFTAEDYNRLMSEKEELQRELEGTRSGLGLLSDKVEALLANQPQNNQSLEDFDLMEILTDKQKGPLFIQGLVQYNIQQALGNMPEQLTKIDFKVELDEFKSSHPEVMSNGEIRPELAKVMKPLLNKNPDMTYEEAYEWVREAQQTAISEKSVSTASNPPVKTPSTEDIAVKAKRLQNANNSGVSGSLQEDPVIKSVEDAVNLAWAELFRGR